MNDPLEEFEDPALKGAIRRAVEREQAPAQLRANVTQIFAGQRKAANPWTGRRMRLYALAALLVIGLGLGALMLWPKAEPPVPDWFADAMISAHDSYKTVAAHPAGRDLPQNDLNALRDRLKQDVGHPVLVAMLGNGWQFKGAALVEINRVMTSHLMFSRGSDSISIFSISANLLYSNQQHDGSVYSEVRAGHELAGFVSGGAVHCLVAQSADQSISLADVRGLRDKLRESPTAMGATSSPGLSIEH